MLRAARKKQKNRVGTLRDRERLLFVLALLLAVSGSVALCASAPEAIRSAAREQDCAHFGVRKDGELMIFRLQSD